MKIKIGVTTAAAAAVALTGLTITTLLPAQETRAKLQAEAKISKTDAETTALAKMPNGG